MNGRPLEGLSVLVTRPADRASAFADKVEDAGGRAVLLPAIRIRARDPEIIKRELRALETSQPPLFIFVSVNAVAHGLQSVTEIFGEAGILSTAAVGNATARSLAAAGCKDLIVPASGVGSEGLLEALLQVPVADQQVIILRGPAGREKLARDLSKRGARVAQISVYERERPEADDAAISAALGGGMPDVVTISSVETFGNLDAMLGRGRREQLRNAALLVPSQRVAGMVRERGAQGPIILAAGASDEAMLEALREWQSKRGQTSHDEEQDMSEKSQPDTSEQEADTGAASREPESSAQDAATAHEEPVRRAEPAPAAEPKQVVVEKKSGGGLAVLALLLALAAAVSSGYLWWQSRGQEALVSTEVSGAQSRFDAELSALRGEIASRDDQFSDLLSDQQGVLLKLEGFDELNLRVQGIENELQATRGVSASARRNWVLAEAAYFLQAANASLQLNRNVASALSALEAADDRLASLADPSLLPVRSVIARERQALSSLPRADITGIALALGNLAASAGELPTKTDNPSAYATPGQPADDGESGGMERARRVLGDAVKSLVTVRRTDQQASALLAPEEEFFLARNLELQLLTARLALLTEQPELFKQSLAMSLEWLTLFFDTEAPEVADAMRRLQEIESTPARRILPDISESLTLLRAIQAQGSTP